MDDFDFRAALEGRGFSQAGFARFLKEHGDPRSVPTILRSVANWARNVNPPPGEIRVVFALLDKLQNG
jgi:hypothetical protein